MNKNYYQFKYTHKKLPGWLAVLLGAAAVAAFFILALPVFLAAVVVFGAVGAYLAYKVKKTIDQVEKVHFEHFNKTGFKVDDEEFIIDITPDEHGADFDEQPPGCRRLPRI